MQDKLLSKILCDGSSCRKPTVGPSLKLKEYQPGMGGEGGKDTIMLYINVCIHYGGLGLLLKSCSFVTFCSDYVSNEITTASEKGEENLQPSTFNR